MKPELEYEAYCRSEHAINLVANYIYELKSREPPLKFSQIEKYREWSSSKQAAEQILEMLLDGDDPVIAVEDYAVQMDYFSMVASVSGNFDSSTMFAICSDTAIYLLDVFHKNDIHYEEDIYNEDEFKCFC